MFICTASDHDKVGKARLEELAAPLLFVVCYAANVKPPARHKRSQQAVAQVAVSTGWGDSCCTACTARLPSSGQALLHWHVCLPASITRVPGPCCSSMVCSFSALNPLQGLLLTIPACVQQKEFKGAVNKLLSRHSSHVAQGIACSIIAHTISQMQPTKGMQVSCLLRKPLRFSTVQGGLSSAACSGRGTACIACWLLDCACMRGQAPMLQDAWCKLHLPWKTLPHVWSSTAQPAGQRGGG